MTENIDKEDYMGIVVVNHYTPETPLECMGAQIDSVGITEVALYEASFDVEERRPIKGDLISKLRMTDWQFGTLVGRPNYNEGVLCTLEKYAKANVLPVSQAVNIEKSSLSKKADKALSHNTQISSFIEELNNYSLAISKKGRIGVSDTKGMIKLAKVLKFNLSSNENHDINLFHEKARERYFEVLSNIHNTVKDSYRLSGYSLIENKTESQSSGFDDMSPAVFFNVSTGTSSSQNLFDDYNTRDSLVSMTLHTAELEIREDPSRDDCYSSSKSLWKIYLSPEQYARFLRADKAEVSCTIQRLNRKSTGTVDDYHTAMSLSDSALSPKKNTPQTQVDLFESLDTISSKLKDGLYKGKIGISQLCEDTELLTSLYDAHVKGRVVTVENALEEIMVDHNEKTKKSLNLEVSLLPDALKDQAFNSLSLMLKKSSDIKLIK